MDTLNFTVHNVWLEEREVSRGPHTKLVENTLRVELVSTDGHGVLHLKYGPLDVESAKNRFAIEYHDIIDVGDADNQKLHGLKLHDHLDDAKLLALRAAGHGGRFKHITALKPVTGVLSYSLNDNKGDK